jgi:uncharacterized membrane protein
MIDSTEYAKYKKITATVYFLQLCSIFLAGFPLLMGVAINFFHRKDVHGTWLESHFDWQIKTAWITVIGFSIGGMTFGSPISIFALIVSLAYLVFRVFEGWNALDKNYDIGVD